jgi:hypothetical protein
MNEFVKRSNNNNNNNFLIVNNNLTTAAIRLLYKMVQNRKDEHILLCIETGDDQK